MQNILNANEKMPMLFLYVGHEIESLVSSVSNHQYFFHWGTVNHGTKGVSFIYFSLTSQRCVNVGMPKQIIHNIQMLVIGWVLLITRAFLLI